MLVFVFINFVFVQCIAMHCSALQCIAVHCNAMMAGATGETRINYRSDLCAEPASTGIIAFPSDTACVHPDHLQQ